MKIEVYSPTIRRKEMDAVLTALVEDKIGPGEQARILIQIAKEYLGFDYCLALRSPAIALYTALKSLDLKDGEGVLISALSPRYYLRVIEDLRLKPVYCDVSPFSASISRETLETALGAVAGEIDVRCLVVHHTLGFLPDMAALAEFGLPVIEDCSQSYGASLGERQGGSFGVFALLGLEERDMLTSGGGALLYAVNRRDASVLRNAGDLPPEYKLPDMNAAMAVVQFRESAKNLEKRREIARIYTQAALRTRHKRFIQRDDTEYNHYAFPLILETGAKDVKAYARRKDIAVESAFEDTLVGSGLVSPALCPESYSLSLRTVLFPLYPRLGALETEKVAKLIVSVP
ncbi:MAG: DegT/DnrJ/EryC1/StrS family aminotransferase [Treponema sp.]|jgi:dTDP-4-amino-4,6-dideoxygalactose transaminase|nr:DegT/DnrJ/EryC1/StrS family aminotransferase [Treponema sp.]